MRWLAFLTLAVARAALALTITATAQLIDCHTIEVAWHDDSGAPQWYSVERSDDGGVTFHEIYHQPAPSDGSGAIYSYQDGTCLPETTYIYRVGIVPAPPHVVITQIAPIV